MDAVDRALWRLLLAIVGCYGLTRAFVHADLMLGAFCCLLLLISVKGNRWLPQDPLPETSMVGEERLELVDSAGRDGFHSP